MTYTCYDLAIRDCPVDSAVLGEKLHDWLRTQLPTVDEKDIMLTKYEDEVLDNDQDFDEWVNAYLEHCRGDVAANDEEWLASQKPLPENVAVEMTTENVVGEKVAACYAEDRQVQCGPLQHHPYRRGTFVGTLYVAGEPYCRLTASEQGAVTLSKHNDLRWKGAKLQAAYLNNENLLLTLYWNESPVDVDIYVRADYEYVKTTWKEEA